MSAACRSMRRSAREYGQRLAGAAEDLYAVVERWRNYEKFIGPLKATETVKF